MPAMRKMNIFLPYFSIKIKEDGDWTGVLALVGYNITRLAGDNY
jgi:hypothetical protein